MDAEAGKLVRDKMSIKEKEIKEAVSNKQDQRDRDSVNGDAIFK